MKTLKSFLANKNGLLILALILSLAMAILFCSMKYGMHIDELFTYGLSNSHYAPFVHNIKDAGLEDQVLTHQDFMNYLTVDQNEVFDYKSVFYNQTQDTHPPLYYCVLNTVSSLFQNTFSKWLGLIPNLMFYLGTVLFLFLSCDKLLNNKRVAFIASLTYGLSRIALSNMLMIRMYMLMVFLTSALILLFVCLMEKPRWYLYILVLCVVFLGAMTQFYFCIYACFICAAFDLFSLIKKKYKQLVLLSCSALAGVVLMIAVYPHILQTLFKNGGNVSGKGMLHNLLTPSVWFEKFSSYISSIVTNYIVALTIGFILLVIIIVWSIKKSRRLQIDHEILVIAVPAIISLVIIILISPANSSNYISNLFLPASICLAFLISKAAELTDIQMNKKWIMPVVSAAVFVICLSLNLVFKPGYLFLGFKEYDDKVDDYYQETCIAYTDSSIPLTQSMLQLLHFKEVFVCDETDSDKLIAYSKANRSDRTIVYVSRVGSMEDLDPEWVASEIAKNTGFSAEKELYSFESYSVFLLER